MSTFIPRNLKLKNLGHPPSGFQRRKKWRCAACKTQIGWYDPTQPPPPTACNDSRCQSTVARFRAMNIQIPKEVQDSARAVRDGFRGVHAERWAYLLRQPLVRALPITIKAFVLSSDHEAESIHDSGTESAIANIKVQQLRDSLTALINDERALEVIRAEIVRMLRGENRGEAIDG